jgi:hypothetical protein
MRISFDPAQRERTLSARGLDLADAARIFAGKAFELEDKRRDHGEQRIICYGLLAGRLVAIANCQR